MTGEHGAPYIFYFLAAWMPDYRRVHVPGGTYFFTLVTYQRRRILCDDIVRQALRDAIITTRQQFPFSIDAWVLLPDHLHCILILPEGDSEYSKRWSMIKRLVTQRVGGDYAVDGARGAPYGGDAPVAGARGAPNLKRNVGCAMRTSTSRLKRREGTIWQRRFWEHLIRDEPDLNRCRDYLHWNPIKHGLVSRLNEWPYSSFHRCVKEGFYDSNWGTEELIDDAFWGE